jgi:Cof subfamily protein (haloacid dehalogenase superfamily)
MSPVSLIATDLDGTLLRDDGSISPRTREAIRSAQQAGLPVVFVTARPPRDVRDLAHDAGIDGIVVCSNGAILYDVAADRFTRHERLGAELALELIKTLRSKAPEIAFATEHGHRFGYEPHFPRLFEDTVHHHPVRVDHAHRLCEDEVTKLLVHHPGHAAESLAELVRAETDARAMVTHSGGPFIEIGAPGVSKASGLEALCGQLGAPADQVIAFGDMPNDLPMLRFAGRAVAVANAHPDVLAIADEIAASNEEDGVARTIEALLDRRVAAL